MPKGKLRMNQIKEVLRLRYEVGCSQEAIANSTRIPRSTVRDYLARAKQAGIGWPVAQEMSVEEVHARLFQAEQKNSSKMPRPLPAWTKVHKDLTAPGVTLRLLWEEYRQDHPNGYQYSWFAHKYRQWARKLDVWMPQAHKVGEKTFVDYSGLKLQIWAPNLQDIAYEAEIFVGVLGGSDLIFCIASKSQQLHDWISVHRKMFEYYGGVTDLVVPDNLKSGVSKSHRYEPSCNRTYEECSQHYGFAIMPARSYKPQDKAKVEKAVQLVQQQILARLRNERLTSIEQANEKIAVLLEDLNNRHSKAFGCSRRALFEEVEKAALKPLVSTPYEIAYWETIRVNGGYHVCVNKHHYSVPNEYVHKMVDIRISEKTIEIFHNDQRIACHLISDNPGNYTTLESHRPEAHRQQASCNEQELKSWASGIGIHTEQFICRLFDDSKRHLHQKERSALGILRLSNAYSDELLEEACKKALDIGTCRYDSVESLIKRISLPTDSQEQFDYQTPTHENVRGPNYYMGATNAD